MKPILKPKALQQGQQVIVKLSKLQVLPSKESTDGDPRFLVIGEIQKTKEKVLIPAFTCPELKKILGSEKDFTDETLLKEKKYIAWETKKFVWNITKTVTPRWLDFEQVYLLSQSGTLRKYDNSFISDSVSLTPDNNYYNDNSKKYDFNQENLKKLFKKAQVVLQKQELILDKNNTIDSIQQASQLGVIQPKIIKTLTMQEKADKFKQAINKLNENKTVINIFIYSQKTIFTNPNTIDEFNELILQKELLNELAIKTDVDLTKQDLEQFKITLFELLDDEQVVLNLNFTQENGKEKNIITDKIKTEIITKTNLNFLLNLFFGYTTMQMLKILDINKSNIIVDELIQEQLDEVKALLCLINEERKKIDPEKQEILDQFEKNKQEKLNILIEKIKVVNTVQKINYFQKKLLEENKDFLVNVFSFARIHDLTFSFKDIENYINQKNAKLPIDNEKIDDFFNKNFSEIVNICQLATPEFIKKPSYSILKLFQDLNALKEIEINKILKIEKQAIIFDKPQKLQNIDVLIGSYFKEETINKFMIGNYFILPEEIKSECLSGYEKTKQKLEQTISILEKHQIESKDFQKDLNQAFESSNQKINEMKEIERIKTGDWKVNDNISANIKNISGINDLNITTFKVLKKIEKNCFIILYNSASDKTPIFKIREITIDNCKTILPKLDIVTFTQNFEYKQVLESPEIIKEYIEWKSPDLYNKTQELCKKLEEEQHPILYFSNFNKKNISEDWEWAVSLEQITNKLPKNIKDYIKKGEISFEITKESKKDIENTSLTRENIEIKLNIFAHTEFKNINYKMTTPNIKFQINRGHKISKAQLKNIRETVQKIQEMMQEVEKCKKETIKELTIIQEHIIQLLKNKKVALNKLSNHTNLRLHQINKSELKEIKTNIMNIYNVLKNKKTELLNIRTLADDNVLSSKYQKFIDHYTQATEVTPSDMKFFLHWDKDYDFFKKRLLKSGFNNSPEECPNFENYLSFMKGKYKTIITSISEDIKTNIIKIEKSKFQKLNWWQKIKNKLSWTWQKTKEKIVSIKKENDLFFENNDSRLQKLNSTKYNFLEKNDTSKSPLTLCDQWIFESESEHTSEIGNKIDLFSKQDSSNSCINSEFSDFDSTVTDKESGNSYDSGDKKINRRVSRDSDISLGDNSNSSTSSFDKNTTKICETLSPPSQSFRM